jgi:hypothetical protein
VAFLALAASAACGNPTGPGAAPLDLMHRPTGLAVLDGRVLVASSNADLLYSQDTGGVILSLDPSSLDTVRLAGAVNVQSFAGELAVAKNVPQTPGAPEPDHCGTDITTPLAVFATRGSNTLNVVSVDPAGQVACEFCDIHSSGAYADPFPVAIGCAPGRPRAFIGYLSTQYAQGWVSQMDLRSGGVITAPVGSGIVRSLTYDVAHDRLYLAQLATSVPTPLRWISLGDCDLGAVGPRGCNVYQANLPGVPAGSEIRAIALGHPFPTGCSGAACQPQRAYVTVRLYDTASAAAVGGRNSDAGGLLVVLDLVEDSFGSVTPTLVRIVPETGTLGRGLQDVRVFPARSGKRDVVATVAVDDDIVWIFDDETQELVSFLRDPITGAPELGHQPSGLAVDSDATGTTARLWVGSYLDDFVTPIDVTLDPVFGATFAGGFPHRITGGTP